jgi:pimeloyl-ACP methyl ester carboxylesterase
METAESWPGRLLSTSRGQIFVRQFEPGTKGQHPADVDGPANTEPRLTMLFVHGLGGESLDWLDVATALRDVVDCLGIDMPGFAHSPLPLDGDLSLDGMARAVADVARMANGPVHLVGNSLGGAIVVRVAAEHPELVASLTLVAPALPDLHPRLGSVQLLIGLTPVVGPLIVRTIINADPEWMAKRIYALCYGDPSAVTPQRHARELATLRQRASLAYSPRVYREALRATVMSYVDRSPRRMWRQAAAVGVPTLVIAGGRDKLVKERVIARAKRTFRDAEVARFAAVGHVAHLEDPAGAAAAIRAFLSRRGLMQGMGERRGTVVEVTGPSS